MGASDESRTLTWREPTDPSDAPVWGRDGNTWTGETSQDQVT